MRKEHTVFFLKWTQPNNQTHDKTNFFKGVFQLKLKQFFVKYLSFRKAPSVRDPSSITVITPVACLAIWKKGKETRHNEKPGFQEHKIKGPWRSLVSLRFQKHWINKSLPWYNNWEYLGKEILRTRFKRNSDTDWVGK